MKARSRLPDLRALAGRGPFPTAGPRWHAILTLSSASAARLKHEETFYPKAHRDADFDAEGFNTRDTLRHKPLAD